MKLKDKLLAGNASILSYNGVTPPKMKGSTDNSALHNTYSLNGLPPEKKKPEPSILDLNGETPTNNYKSNLPDGASI